MSEILTVGAIAYAAAIAVAVVATVAALIGLI